MDKCTRQWGLDFWVFGVDGINAGEEETREARGRSPLKLVSGIVVEDV